MKAGGRNRILEETIGRTLRKKRTATNTVSSDVLDFRIVHMKES